MTEHDKGELEYIIYQYIYRLSITNSIKCQFDKLIQRSEAFGADEATTTPF